MSSWSKFRQLTWDECFLLLDAFSSIAFASFVVHLLPYRFLRHAVESPGRGNAILTRRRSIQQIVYSVGAVSRFVPGSTCLVRAIAACKILHCEGYPAQIQFGVLNSGREFAAHAWVEVEGEIVFNRDEAYKPFRQCD
jgi:hypothetical protein